MNGHFLLQLNTTSTAKQVRAINTAANAGNDNYFVDVTLDPNSLYIAGSASINLLDAISMTGAIALKIDNSGVQAAAELVLELGDLGSIDINGAIAFLTEADGDLMFALRMEADVRRHEHSGIKAHAILEINTGDEDYTTLIGNHVIRAGTILNIRTRRQFARSGVRLAVPWRHGTGGNTAPGN